MNNKILKNWFWPWQIFFNKQLKKQVNDFAQNLQSNEYLIYKYLIRFHCSFFTLQMLIDYLIEFESEQKYAINFALKNINKITNIPIELKQEFVNKINKLNTKFKNELLNILEYATKTNKKLNYKNYFIKLLGKNNFDHIFNDFYICKQIPQANYNLSPLTNIDLLHQQYLKIINDNNFKHQWQGVIPNYKIKTKIGEGFGEYWDNYFFYNYKCNTLILFKNKTNSQLDNLYTLFHEVYPGHGNFYSILKNNNNYIDLGSTIIIEGFATFCELSVNFDKKYEEYYFNKYCYFLNCVFNHNINSLDHYEKMNAINYPFFKESYYVGALLFLKKLKTKQEIAKFYKQIISNNLTNALALFLK